MEADNIAAHIPLNCEKNQISHDILKKPLHFDMSVS